MNKKNISTLSRYTILKGYLEQIKKKQPKPSVKKHIIK